MPRRFLRFVVYFFVAFLSVWLFLSLLSSPREVVTETVIRAPIQNIWNTVIDVDSYPSWNPLYVSGTGKIALNSSVDLEIHLPGRQKFHMHPFVDEAKEVETLHWTAGYMIPGFFDLTSRIDMRFQDVGTVKVTHTQRFTGLLVGPLTDGMIGRWEEGSTRMLEALKTRCQRN